LSKERIPERPACRCRHRRGCRYPGV